MSASGEMAFRILNTEPGRFSQRATAELRVLGAVTDFEADRSYLLANVAGFHALFIGLRNTLDATILRRAANLRCIVSPTTGLNHIDTDTARQLGVTVISLKGETEFLRGITATAELTWGLLLSLIRRIPAACASVKTGLWRRDDFIGRELQGRTLGIVGCGRLGAMVADYGRAFRMKVLAYDRETRDVAGVEFTSMPELLARADVVSIHLPLDASTQRSFGAEQFAAMRDGAILLNTARGEIVDEVALLASLKSGKLAGAAVDVLGDEVSLQADWLTRSGLHGYAKLHDNLLITPHIGGATHDSVEATNLFMISKLQEWLARAREVRA